MAQTGRAQGRRPCEQCLLAFRVPSHGGATRCTSLSASAQKTACVGPFLKSRAIERHAYTVREQFVSRGDKAVRAQSMRGRMAMLGLYLRQSAPWFADLRAELLSFSAGRHDDQVDALGLVGQLLDKISAEPRPRPPDVTQPDGYRAAFEETPDDSWKTM